MSITNTTVRPIELSDLGQPKGEAENAVLSDGRQPVPSASSQHENAGDAVNEGVAPDDSVEVAPDGGYGWTVVAACSFLLFWINGYITAWGVLQTAIVKSPGIHTDIRTITFVGSLAMGCIVALGLVSVRLMGSFGVRYTTLAATVLFALSLIATSFVLDSIGGLFCIAGALSGLGASVIFTSTNSLPLQWFSSKLGLANGLVKMGGGIGATALPIAAQALLDGVGLQWTFRILGGLVLVTGGPCALLLNDRTRTAAAARFDWNLLKNVSFLTLTLAGAVGVFAMYVPPYFLPLFASSIGLSASTGAGLVGGFGAATAIGRLLGGWFCDRVGALNALAITTFVNSFSMFAIWPVSSSLPPLFIFAIINGFAIGRAHV